MSDKRYEFSGIFHSGKDEDDIVVDLFKLLGDSLALSIHEIPDVDDVAAEPVGGWVDR